MLTKEMTKLIITGILLGLFLYACRRADTTERVDIIKIDNDIHKIPYLELSDSFKVYEIINPQSIKFYKKWIVAFNLVNDNNVAPLYFFNIDNFHLDFTLGKFGKGPNEFTDLNPYYFYKTDSSFIINVDNYFEWQYSQRGDTFFLNYKKPIAYVDMNNLVRINDSLYVFESFEPDKEFVIYNSKLKKQVKRFGDYPQLSGKFEDFDDKRNFLGTTIVKEPSGDKMAVFFENIPYLRYYDDQGGLLKELHIQIKDPAGCNSAEDFYDSKCKIYFAAPWAGNSGIYVLFINKTGPEMMKKGRDTLIELQKWDWEGKLIERFSLKDNFDHFIVSDDEKELYLFSVRPDHNIVYKATLN